MRLVLVILSLLAVAAVGLYLGTCEEVTRHQDCVEARKIEGIVGRPQRKCPPPSWLYETYGHTAADHG